MKITVGKYVNERINRDVVEGQRRTVDCTLRPVDDDRVGLGGCDHFMCTSIKTIVSYYVRRLKRATHYGYPGASYNIEITLSDEMCGPVTGTIVIPIRCD